MQRASYVVLSQHTPRRIGTNLVDEVAGRELDSGVEVCLEDLEREKLGISIEGFDGLVVCPLHTDNQLVVETVLGVDLVTTKAISRLVVLLAK
jgi:hypothetical protein